MNKNEFLKKLELLLQDLSEKERDDAIQYYYDYFEDAGEDKVESVICELGSPEQVAQVIRISINDESTSNGSYGESGYSDHRFVKKEEIEINETLFEKGEKTNQQKVKEQSKLGNLVLVIVILVLASPFIIGGLGGAFGILVACAATVGIALPVTGVAFFGLGIVFCFVEIGTGLFFMGMGILIFLLGVILSVILVKIVANVLPRAIRAIVKVLRKLVGRRG